MKQHEEVARRLLGTPCAAPDELTKRVTRQVTGAGLAPCRSDSALRCRPTCAGATR